MILNLIVYVVVTADRELMLVFHAGRKLSVDTDAIKRKFYTTCNCLLGNTYSLNEILRVNLQDSYCLPILLL